MVSESSALPLYILHISREDKVLLIQLPLFSAWTRRHFGQGAFECAWRLAMSGSRVCSVQTNFIQKYLQCNTMKFVYKIIKVCMQNEENQGHKRRLVFTMNRVSGVFVLNKVRVWMPQWHSSNQVSLEVLRRDLLVIEWISFILLKEKQFHSNGHLSHPYQFIIYKGIEVRDFFTLLWH